MPRRPALFSTSLSTGRTCSAPTARSPTRAEETRRRRAGSVDHAGRETRTLWVKGSGSDLATIAPAGFAALRLDEVLPLESARRDGRRRDGRLPAVLRPDARSASPVDRNTASRVHPGDARRSHASRCSHRADVDARRAVAGGRSVRRRGGLARLRTAGLPDVEAHRRAAARRAERARRTPRAARPGYLG